MAYQRLYRAYVRIRNGKLLSWVKLTDGDLHSESAVNRSVGSRKESAQGRANILSVFIQSKKTKQKEKRVIYHEYKQRSEKEMKDN